MLTSLAVYDTLLKVLVPMTVMFVLVPGCSFADCLMFLAVVAPCDKITLLSRCYSAASYDQFYVFMYTYAK